MEGEKGKEKRDSSRASNASFADTPFNVIAFDVLPSTQDAVRERLEAEEAVHGLVIRARCQTSGRGRRARDWHSAAGGSYQTLAVRAPALHAGLAPVTMALGLAESFEAYGVKLGIKWPNDLYYHGKKLAGILCEMVRGYLLIGVGVNVNNPVPESASALRGWDPEVVDAVVLEGLRWGLERLERPQEIPERFSRYDLLYGQRVSDEKGREVLAQGIDREGRLLLLDEAGKLDPFSGHLVAFSLTVGP